MSSKEIVISQWSNGIGLIQINRPKKKNAEEDGQISENSFCPAILRKQPNFLMRKLFIIFWTFQHAIPGFSHSIHLPIEYFGELTKVKLNYNYLNLQVHPGRHLDQPVSIQAHQPRYRRPLPHQYPPEGLALWASGVHPVVWESTSSKRGPGVLWATMVSSSNPGA